VFDFQGHRFRISGTKVVRSLGLPVLIAASAWLTLVPFAAEAEPIENSSLAMRFCQIAVNAEVARSLQSVPDGLTQFTCQCVLRQLDLSRTLKLAQSTCRQEAIRRYGL
jgi:hypothetical protein